MRVVTYKCTIVNVIKTHLSIKLTALASDWLAHFSLLLCYCCISFDDIRKVVCMQWQCSLSNVRFDSFCIPVIKMAAFASKWLTHLHKSWLVVSTQCHLYYIFVFRPISNCNTLLLAVNFILYTYILYQTSFVFGVYLFAYDSDVHLGLLLFTFRNW